MCSGRSDDGISGSLCVGAHSDVAYRGSNRGREAQRLDAIAALTELSLVKHDPFEDGTEALTAHRLVGTVALQRAEVKRPRATDAIITRLMRIFPKDGYVNPHSWELCARLIPHLLQLASVSGFVSTLDWAKLLNQAAMYFLGRAVCEPAEILLREALTIREHALGLEHPDIADTLNELGLVLKTKGDFAGALPLYQRALTIDERVFGPEHSKTATTLNNLALLFKDQGDLARARPLFERALAIRETVNGGGSADTALSLSNLALVFQQEGDFASALPLAERAFAIRMNVLGPCRPHTALSLNNLGGILQGQGKLAEAQLLFEGALAMYEAALGVEHPDTAATLNNLGGVLHQQGKFAEALVPSARALAIKEKTRGADHPDTALSLADHAVLLQDSGHTEEAERSFRRAIAIARKCMVVVTRSRNDICLSMPGYWSIRPARRKRLILLRPPSRPMRQHSDRPTRGPWHRPALLSARWPWSVELKRHARCISAITYNQLVGRFGPFVIPVFPPGRPLAGSYPRMSSSAEG